MQPDRPLLHPDHIMPPFQVLGEGGEHIVLNEPYLTRANIEHGGPETDEGDMFVRKYSKLAFIACNSEPLMPVVERYAVATARAARTNERFETLRRQFSVLATPQTSIGNLAVLSDEEVQYIWDGQLTRPDAGIHATVLTFQDRLAAFTQKPMPITSIDLPYAELHGPELAPATYAAVNQRLLVDIDTGKRPTDQETEDFYAVQGNASIFPLPDNGQARGAISRGLRAFGWYAAEFSKASGEGLDLTGPHNAIMNPYGEFRLVDALYPADIPIVQLVPDIVRKVQAGEGLTRRDQINLLNGLGYMRTVNFLQTNYGQTNVIDTLAGTDIKPQTWQTIYSYLTRLTLGVARQPTAIYAE